MKITDCRSNSPTNGLSEHSEIFLNNYFISKIRHSFVVTLISDQKINKYFRYTGIILTNGSKIAASSPHVHSSGTNRFWHQFTPRFGPSGQLLHISGSVTHLVGNHTVHGIRRRPRADSQANGKSVGQR